MAQVQQDQLDDFDAYTEDHPSRADTPTLGQVDGTAMDMEGQKTPGNQKLASNPTITSQLSQHTGASTEVRFYLYTKLNQNETKSLRKASTNVEERRQLAQIFKLKTITATDPTVQPSKVEMLKLDFHYMNYAFCKDNGFSNEKVSTLLAIFDHVFTRMLEKQLKQEDGLKMLKEILKNHAIHRPPYQIFIFNDAEVEKIIQFSISTFLRHFSLYEFAFKPRIELVLRSDPVFNTKMNADLCSLNAMSEVEKEEADKMRMFLGALGQTQPMGKTGGMQELDMEAVAGQSNLNRTGESLRSGASQNISQGAADIQGSTARMVDASQDPNIEIRKIGRVHAGDAPIHDVINAEMARIHKAFDQRLKLHSEELVARAQNGQPLSGGPGNAPKK